MYAVLKNPIAAYITVMCQFSLASENIGRIRPVMAKLTMMSCFRFVDASKAFPQNLDEQTLETL
jgi:hypothetical protein